MCEDTDDPARDFRRALQEASFAKEQRDLQSALQFRADIDEAFRKFWLRLRNPEPQLPSRPGTRKARFPGPLEDYEAYCEAAGIQAS